MCGSALYVCYPYCACLSIQQIMTGCMTPPGNAKLLARPRLMHADCEEARLLPRYDDAPCSSRDVRRQAQWLCHARITDRIRLSVYHEHMILPSSLSYSHPHWRTRSHAFTFQYFISHITQQRRPGATTGPRAALPQRHA